MGVSTDGQLCFGVAFPEGFEFPWDKYQDGDIEKWWRILKGYVAPFRLYDDKGEYLNGKEPTKAQSAEYYDHRAKWLKANPVPVELVNYCSYDCPMYMIAVKSSVKSNSRGFPEQIDPAKLTVSDEEVRVLKDFIEKYVDTDPAAEHDDYEPEPKWYLSSLWG